MNKTRPSLARIAAMVVFALSCFGLLLFLWLAFGGPIPLKPEGYLFYLAWVAHNGVSLFSVGDSTGVIRPVGLQLSCQTILGTLSETPELGFIQNLTGAVNDTRICPDQQKGESD